MPDPTLASLDTRLQVVEAKLGIIPTPPIVTAGYPADLISKDWYLTIPVLGPKGYAAEIHQPDLATYASKFFELVPPTPTSPAGIACRTWHGGATTSGSANPRSELREMAGGKGADKASWSSTKGRHQMTINGQVNRLTKVKPQTVIGQIHDDEDDVTVFRVEGGQLWLTKGDTTHGYLLDPAFALGKPYAIGFDVSGGVVSYTYNGAVVPFTCKVKTTGCYFKAGCYLQSNPTTAPTEVATEYSEVILYSVSVTHT